VHGLKEKMPEFLGDGLQSATGNDVAGAEVFEPRPDHKGDVARALLYVYVTYALDAPARSIMKLDNFKQEQAVLLRWNSADPVSAKEKARNEAIYKLQGNRNPFIDHPEWAARLGKLI
jgi:endonuclease I